ncbi:MAG: hypothetical protein GX660_02805 [Clostridiaceae bacterium]|nr:hypothetical protein [Clostridiaceae bacterium]
MKQNISIEDINKLTDIQKEKLRELWQPVPGDVFYYSDGNNWYCHNGEYICFNYEDGFIGIGNERSLYKSFCFPLFSIGQMIEILGKNLSSLGITSGKYYVVIDKIIDQETGEMWNCEEPELCDALWNAIVDFMLEEE